MGKLTEAFKKLDAGRKSFAADADTWQTETKKYFAESRAYQKKLSELGAIDDAVLDKVKDPKERSAKNAELANARGKKLEGLWPERTKAQAAQNKAFENCDSFGKLIDQCEAVLKAYDTKGKPKKEQKKVEAQKLMVQAELDLAQVKRHKIDYDYQGDGSAQFADVEKAIADIERLKKKLADMVTKLKEDVVVVDEAK